MCCDCLLIYFDLLFGRCVWFDSVVLFNADLCKLVLKSLFGFVLLGFGYFDGVGCCLLVCLDDALIWLVLILLHGLINAVMLGVFGLCFLVVYSGFGLLLLVWLYLVICFVGYRSGWFLFAGLCLGFGLLY